MANNVLRERLNNIIGQLSRDQVEELFKKAGYKYKSLEELKGIYNRIKGKRDRMLVWSYIKNFRGWTENPVPYVI